MPISLLDKVQARILFQIRKHDLCKLEDEDKYIKDTINNWTNHELLAAISLELEAKGL